MVVFYYGENASFSCPECVSWERTKGIKWGVLSSALTSPTSRYAASRVAEAYSFVVFPDEDIEMRGSDLDEALRIAEQYRLSLWQPSVCPGTRARWPSLLQEPRDVVRFSNFAEMTRVGVSSEALVDVVAPTLKGASTGWGLDFAWAKLLDYRGVGVVDAVCASDSTREAARLYARAGVSLDDAYAEMGMNLDLYKIAHAHVGALNDTRAVSIVDPARPLRTLGRITKEQDHAHGYDALRAERSESGTGDDKANRDKETAGERNETKQPRQKEAEVANKATAEATEPNGSRDDGGAERPPTLGYRATNKTESAHSPSSPKASSSYSTSSSTLSLPSLLYRRSPSGPAASSRPSLSFSSATSSLLATSSVKETVLASDLPQGAATQPSRPEPETDEDSTVGFGAEGEDAARLSAAGRASVRAKQVPLPRILRSAASKNTLQAIYERTVSETQNVQSSLLAEIGFLIISVLILGAAFHTCRRAPKRKIAP